jgi:hypothetical protein
MGGDVWCRFHCIVVDRDSRKPIRARESMSRLLAAVILIGIATNADNAKGQPQQSDRRTALLQQLRSCLDKVPTQMDVPYTSPA